MGDQRPRHDRYGNPQNYSTDSYPSTGYGRSPASGGYETSYSASSTTSSTPSYNATPASATGPNWRWWISDEGIAREVIQADIQRYLGPEAVVRPGGGLNENQVCHLKAAKRRTRSCYIGFKRLLDCGVPHPHTSKSTSILLNMTSR